MKQFIIVNGYRADANEITDAVNPVARNHRLGLIQKQLEALETHLREDLHAREFRNISTMCAIIARGQLLCGDKACTGHQQNKQGQASLIK